MPLRILGIESSCDDTGVAIVSSPRRILSNVVISQNSEHQYFNGIVPEIAARAHIENLNKATIAALQNSINIESIDAVAATCGPGLISGVIAGSMFAKALSSVLKKPFIAINHLEGHALTIRLTNNIQYPYLLLIMSGGHSQFIMVRGLGKYTILGQTLDDAIGETFDKVAKMLKLPFPGGVEIEKRALNGNPLKYSLPKPMIYKDSCNMSFSGLKTAIRLLIEKLNNSLDTTTVNDIAASFQYTIGVILKSKILSAIKLYEKKLEQVTMKSNKVVISGGVASNQYLRDILKSEVELKNYRFFFPPKQLCTDNAAMIAYAGLERFIKGITNDLNFQPRDKWSIEEV